MFERLQKKWKVNGLQLLLILCTFAIGGSLTGYAGRRLMNLFPLEKGVLWVMIYIILVTLLWPLAVLLVSFPFGQFRFFMAYLRKMGRRIGVGAGAMGSRDPIAIGSGSDVYRIRSQSKEDTSNVVRIAIFASGAGSNAQKIIDHFRNDKRIRIELIVCNKPGAGVLAIAGKEQIPALIIEKEKFFRGDAYTSELRTRNISFIVLAGFLWKIPNALIEAYSHRIINIHPALLPKYGGKGMYGQYVHAAVIAAGETESGITIHYVDGHYDNGDIIFQARCAVLSDDTPESLAERIHQLEHRYYPEQISLILSKGI